MYTISKGIHKLADEYGLVVEPSRKKFYKLDVYNVEGKYITSIGDRRYKDFWIYKKEEGLPYAEYRRAAYYNRHSAGIEHGYKREVLSWILLWNGDY